LELTGLSTQVPTPSLPASSNSSLLDTEVELLVRAHQCFVFSCSLQGSTLVLNVVKSRVKVYYFSPSLFFPLLPFKTFPFLLISLSFPTSLQIFPPCYLSLSPLFSFCLTCVFCFLFFIFCFLFFIFCFLFFLLLLEPQIFVEFWENFLFLIIRKHAKLRGTK
jgi:hypothetical protein